MLVKNGVGRTDTENPRPAIATVESMVAVATQRGSRSSRHRVIIRGRAPPGKGRTISGAVKEF